MTRAHRVLSVAAALALAMFNPASSAPADPGAVQNSPRCAALQGVKISGIAGCSLYRHFRDEPILARDLPVQLNLPDNGERSWIVTVLGLTIFSEARMENDASRTAVAASILNRAGYGKPGFKIESIADAAANNAYSQWLLTSQIIAHKPPPWIQKDLESRGRMTPANLQAELTANARVLQDPIGYAAQYKRGYPEILKSSIVLAGCIIERAESPSRAADLAWARDFGTLFVDPVKVRPDAGDKGACHTHSSYMSNTGRSYCPASTDGVCINTTPDGSKVPTKSNVCGGGEFSAVQHYELSAEHSEDEVRKLNSRIAEFVAACPGAAADRR
jgi:hypothetical protein